MGTLLEPAGVRSTSLRSCNVAADRAVLYGPAISATLDVVQLSTGRVVWHHDYPAGQAPVNPAISGDGRYVAENHGEPPFRNPSADIRDLATGSIVGHVTGWVDDLSWDGRLAVVTTAFGSGSTAVLDWHAGDTGSDPRTLGGPRRRPGGEDLAFDASGGLLLVGGDGRSRTIAEPGVIDNLETLEGVG
jgi:hypothetical protein